MRAYKLGHRALRLATARCTPGHIKNDATKELAARTCTCDTCLSLRQLRAGVEDRDLRGGLVESVPGDSDHGEAAVVQFLELHGALVLVRALVEAEGVKAEVAGQVLVVLEHRRRTDLTRVYLSIRILSYVHVPVCIYEIQVIVLHRHMCIRACTQTWPSPSMSMPVTSSAPSAASVARNP